MADIVLAEFGGTVWLVGGEQHIDALLFNSLAPGIGITFLPCGSRDELQALWGQHGGAENGAEPWAIHPNVVRRIRGTAGQRSIGFAPWSAMLDDAARAAIQDAAASLPGAAAVTLRQFLPAEAPPGLADLQRLRGQLVAGALAAAGLAAERIRHETTAAEDADRLELITGEG